MTPNPAPRGQDYSEFAEKPSQEFQDRIALLVGAMREAWDTVEDAEERLKVAKAVHKEIAERILPEAMGLMTDVTLGSGLRVRIKRTIHASIPVEFRAAAMEWLDEQGHGGMIKREVTVSFGRDQQAQVAALRERLATEFSNVKEERYVESSTLRAWVGENLKAGKDVPLAMFGVWQQQQAEVVKPRKKKGEGAAFDTNDEREQQ